MHNIFLKFMTEIAKVYGVLIAHTPFILKKTS